MRLVEPADEPLHELSLASFGGPRLTTEAQAGKAPTRGAVQTTGGGRDAASPPFRRNGAHGTCHHDSPRVTRSSPTYGQREVFRRFLGGLL